MQIIAYWKTKVFAIISSRRFSKYKNRQKVLDKSGLFK